MPTSATVKSGRAKKVNRGQRRLPSWAVHPMGETSNPLPPSGPTGWQPMEIVLVMWTMSVTPRAYVDWNHPKSGVYTADQLTNHDPGNNNYLNNIDKFALAAASPGQSQLALSPQHPLYYYSGMAAWDVAVWYPCYVVYVLEQTGIEWQFWRGRPAVTTVLGQTDKYFSLYHVLQNGSVQAGTNSNASGCVAAYFSVNTFSGVFSSDPTNMFFEYLAAPSPDYQPWWYDPCIKNDGHPHLESHARKRKF